MIFQAGQVKINTCGNLVTFHCIAFVLILNFDESSAQLTINSPKSKAKEILCTYLLLKFREFYFTNITAK
jgi:hypothetical protein